MGYVKILQHACQAEMWFSTQDTFKMSIKKKEIRQRLISGQFLKKDIACFKQSL